MTTETRFIAFYSYKGGVGRSLALANLACLLAWQGRKVLIIDLDLETPGQHQTSLFRGSYRPGTPIRGILDLLTTYHAHQATHRSDEEPPVFEWDLHRFIRRSTLFDPSDPSSDDTADYTDDTSPKPTPKPAPPGSVWLLPAGGGKVDEVYQAKLADWDWDKFFEDQGEAVLHELRWRLRGEGFDDVLIDSRTGLSDVFYVSTLCLADTVICLSSLNRQNLEGTDLALRTLAAPQNRERYGDKRMLLVLSPLPYDLLSEPEITQRLVEIRNNYPHLAGWVAELPFVPRLALDETILVAESSDPQQSGSRYVQQMARLLAAIDKPESDIAAKQEPKPGNPFQRARIEYWPPAEIVNHFVDPGGNLMAHLTQFMPTVVFGSRGTGKTTLARWFSYETQQYLLKNSGRSLGPENIERIGLWFRLDIDLLNAFVTSDQEREPVYTRMFGQFLDLLVVRKALAALEALGGISAWGDEERIFHTLAREIGINVPRLDHAGFAEAIDDRLAEIRRYVNNPLRGSEPYVVQGNILMKLLVEELLKGDRFGLGHEFAVFIDEYENFHAYQQRVVNTRLKQVKESDRVTYKLLARNLGIRDYQTLAEDQPIEVTHDFRAYYLDEDIEFEDFANHVRQVVQRHLEGAPWFARRGLVDPGGLLPGLSPAEEALRLTEKAGNAPLRDFLKKEHGNPVAERFEPWMAEEPNLLRQAVAVVLLNQGKVPEEVLAAMHSDSAAARDWYHNYHIGALFWLGSLYRQRGRQKLYTGLNHIVGVAGGNIRVALDLCHAILERWLRDSPDHRVPIDPMLQSDAICDQSEVYLRKLRGQSEPSILRLVDRLGRLFEIIHKGPRQGEPEINHFVISDEPDSDILELLRRCRAEGILRWLPGNKQKSRSDAHRDAWQLHPRYAPAFNISWRRKKRLDLSTKDLHALSDESETEWKALERRIESRYRKIGPARQEADDRQGRLSL